MGTPHPFTGKNATPHPLGVAYIYVLDVRFTVSCVFDVIFTVENSKLK
jgi:hypothetical protein